MSSVLAILPTYNERENIIDVVESVLAQDPGFEVLVVDDMSPDGTAALVRDRFGDSARVHTMEREGPRGRGFAGVAGFKWALEKGYDIVFEMDADGSHDPVYLPEMVRAMDSADVVIASRLVPGGGEQGRGISRRLVTLAANAYLQLMLGLPVRDCTTGYRGFRREALAAVPWDRVLASGPSIVQEVLFAVCIRGFRAREIPFMFMQRKAGRSKLNLKLLVAGLLEAPKIRRRMRV